MFRRLILMLLVLLLTVALWLWLQKQQPQATIIVTGNTLTCAGKTYPCAIGRNGTSQQKREGDGCSPIGVFPLRRVLYRPDKLNQPPRTGLPVQPLSPADGWCDDPTHADYNRPVRLPFPASHERLWRDDDLYDVIVVIGYNDSPIQAGLGSAIFMHIARPGLPGTAGCVALPREALLEVLATLPADATIEIRQR